MAPDKLKQAKDFLNEIFDMVGVRVEELYPGSAGNVALGRRFRECYPGTIDEYESLCENVDCLIESDAPWAEIKTAIMMWGRKILEIYKIIYRDFVSQGKV